MGAGMRRKRKAMPLFFLFFLFPPRVRKGMKKTNTGRGNSAGVRVGKRRKMPVEVAGQVGRGDLSGLPASVWDFQLWPTLVPTLSPG